MQANNTNSKPWIVYVCEAAPDTIGMLLERFAFQGMAQKYADRMADHLQGLGSGVKLAVRYEEE